METLTRVLSKRVYNLDLNNLPLEKLQDNRTKRLRGPRTPNADKDRGKHDRTFSRGWSRCDSSSPKSSDEIDGKMRDRISTVGSRDDLDRLRYKKSFMRDVTSKEEATNVLASLNKCELETYHVNPEVAGSNPALSSFSFSTQNY